MLWPTRARSLKRLQIYLPLSGVLVHELLFVERRSYFFYYKRDEVVVPLDII